ncbi:pyridoxal 5'-phosphate synthase-like subunit PDX1.2, partial [Tanacetum coccineum]
MLRGFVVIVVLVSVASLFSISSLATADLENERTLAIVKPDGVSGKYISSIKKIILESRFTIQKELTVHLDEDSVTHFYAEHSTKSFFPSLVKYMTSGQVLIMVLEKTNAIADWRALIGPTDARKAKVTHPDSIRAMCGQDLERNCVHGLDSHDSAAREISFFFTDDCQGMVLTLTPFNGSNFMGWSRTVKMALGAKLKLGFINGTCVKPAMDGENLQRWIRCDYMVSCWILNSMVAELSEAFLYAQSAAELWKEIAERYGQSNGPLIYQLQRELSNVSQGNLTIAAYFNKLKRCWDELHNLNGIPVCSCGKMQECSCNLVDKFLEIEGKSKLIQFLMKLNDEYESVRNQILAMDPLPTVNKAYYIVQQIEKQKQVTNHVAEPMAFYANMNQNKAGRKDVKGGRNDGRGYKHCTNCDQDGHIAEQCFEKIAAVCQEVMKMFQGKHGGQDLNGASTSMHHAGMSLHVRTFALSSQSNGIRINQWIIDTGASDDMCPHITLFSTTFILTQPITVHLPDGTSKLVKTAGHIQLTPSVMLFNVLYVPEFKFNLLSVGKLLNTQKYFAQFFPSYCVFQDLLTKKVVAVGKGSRCLYTCTSLDPTSIPTGQQVVNSINVFDFQNSPVFSNSVLPKSTSDLYTIHARLGHLSVSKMVHLHDCKGLNKTDFTCDSCLLAKFHRLPFPKHIPSSIEIFELIHVDLWG